MRDTEVITELGKDLYNFRNITFLFILDAPVHQGAVQAIKNWLNKLIEEHSSLLSRYGADMEQFIKIAKLMEPIEVEVFRENDLLLERIPKKEHRLPAGVSNFVFRNELEKINKNHPDLEPIKKVIAEIENEIFYKTPTETFYLQNKLDNIKNGLAKFEIQEVSLELLALRALLYDVMKLKKLKFKSLNKLLKKLLKCPESQYYGTRYEILIARVLVENNVSFSMPDPPDFLILEKDYPNVKMECTSKHFTVKKKNEDILKGIFSTIDKKDDSKFDFDSNTVLAMDITNLGSINENFFADEHSKNIKILSDKVNNSGFGSAIFSTWVLDEQNHAYTNIYNRIDSHNIGAELKQFLNKYWPKDTTITTSPHFRIPKVG
jgi:ribosome biogenesis protein Nip4